MVSEPLSSELGSSALDVVDDARGGWSCEPIEVDVDVAEIELLTIGYPGHFYWSGNATELTIVEQSIPLAGGQGRTAVEYIQVTDRAGTVRNLVSHQSLDAFRQAKSLGVPVIVVALDVSAFPEESSSAFEIRNAYAQLDDGTVVEVNQYCRNFDIISISRFLSLTNQGDTDVWSFLTAAVDPASAQRRSIERFAEAYSEAERAATNPAWADIEEADRVVALAPPGVVPEEVAALYNERTIWILIPDTWRSLMGGTICTRVQDGRGPHCVLTSVEGTIIGVDVPPGVTPAPLRVVVPNDSSQSFEIVLSENRPGVALPVPRSILGAVSAAYLNDNPNPQVVVIPFSDAARELTTFESIASSETRGESLLGTPFLFDTSVGVGVEESPSVTLDSTGAGAAPD